MVLNEEIKKILQLSEDIQNSLGLSSHLSEMLELQEQIKKSFSGVNMFTEIFETMQNHKWLTNPAQSTIEEAIKSIGLNSKIELPQQAVDSIKSILHQNEQLGSSMRALTKSLELQYPSVSQINNLQFVLNSISVDLLAFAAREQNWDMLDEFKYVTEHALEFSESLTDEVTEEQKIQFETLISLLISFFKKHPKLGVSAVIVIDIIIRVASMHQYYEFIREKPELATKSEINKIEIKQDSVFHLIHLLNEQLIQSKVYRITNRICDVKLKPKSKILTLTKLPKDFEVIVIQIHHKWVYVSYFDPKDNLPQTGWIMKKYLDKPE
jgi:hypothetical protein